MIRKFEVIENNNTIEFIIKHLEGKINTSNEKIENIINVENVEKLNDMINKYQNSANNDRRTQRIKSQLKEIKQKQIKKAAEKGANALARTADYAAVKNVHTKRNAELKEMDELLSKKVGEFTQEDLQNLEKMHNSIFNRNTLSLYNYSIKANFMTTDELKMLKSRFDAKKQEIIREKEEEQKKGLWGWFSSLTNLTWLLGK